jgi:predicted signal transduction protein with EAL and GGDEF domain
LAGDSLLQVLARRITGTLRATDLVARFAGDEFVILLGGEQDHVAIEAVAHKLLAAIETPTDLDGPLISVTPSIGVALFPLHASTSAELLKHADTAMYHAKDIGRDNCQFYSSSLTEQAMQRMELETSLRQALERSEFSLVYQPQFDAAATRVNSVEALIRWKHPTRGAIAPLDFIPLAEENGLIVPIGEWVLRTACTEAAHWQRAGHPLRVAVNLSPMQFRDPGLVKTVLDVLQHTGLPPDMLELEVTESAVMEEGGTTLATLESLRKAGVRVALDDFGTGYSSMSYLKRMPLNNLKIDRTFIKGLPDGVEDRAIVRAILSMARSLAFSVTAEGVETAEQARLLQDMSCDTLQGYYFGRPVPAADLPALIGRLSPAAEDKPNLVDAHV